MKITFLDEESQDKKQKKKMVKITQETNIPKEEKAAMDFMRNNSVNQINAFKDLADLVADDDLSDTVEMISLSKRMYKINGLYSEMVDLMKRLTNSGFLIKKCLGLLSISMREILMQLEV